MDDHTDLLSSLLSDNVGSGYVATQWASRSPSLLAHTAVATCANALGELVGFVGLPIA